MTKFHSKNRSLHEESLLRVPLVASAMDDSRIRWTARPVDRRWSYLGHRGIASAGFRPFDGRVFFGAHSLTAQWLNDPEGSARRLNHDDQLVREILFLVHDYLHAWSVALIRQLEPDLGLGVRPVDEDNFESIVFCLLLTEAVATVGVDYWFLNAGDINRYCPLGSRIAGLTVGYRESLLAEYRRFLPELSVQDPRFVSYLNQIYCSGAWNGLDEDTLIRSPALHHWVSKELGYGVSQRTYCRQWLTHLFPAARSPTVSDSDVVECDRRWQRELTSMVAAATWRRVKADSLEDAIDVAPADATWRRTLRATETPDPRFTNISSCTSEQLDRLNGRALPPMVFDIAKMQILARHDFSQTPAKTRAALPDVIHRRDLRALRMHMVDVPRIITTDVDEQDMLFVS